MKLLGEKATDLFLRTEVALLSGQQAQVTEVTFFTCDCNRTFPPNSHCKGTGGVVVYALFSLAKKRLLEETI